jgi:hypothetical protein
MKKEQALIVFIKNNGNEKSRIAEIVGREKASFIYSELLAECYALCKSLDFCDLIIYYSDKIEQEDKWSEIANDKRIQKDGNLGFKMQEAINETLDDYKKIILIGSDCPYITKEDLKEGFISLDMADVCLGPCIDGGYYLIGMKEKRNYLFQNIEWSSNSVFCNTIDKIYEHELSVATLNKYSDIDHLEDYNNWKEIKR